MQVGFYTNLIISNYVNLLSLDLAIGAPYGGDEGKGVVYIYVGSMEGIITDVSQVLQGKDISYQLSTFGFSISGGHDLDKNGYPGTFVTENTTSSLVRRPVVI